MRGLLLLIDGFEDVEALAPRDILIRGKVEIDTVGFKENKEVITSHKVLLKTDKYIRDINVSDYDFVILPGGGLGVENLLKQDLEDLLNHFHKNNKIIAAICAAPRVLGKYHLLDKEDYTCFKGCNEGLVGNFTAEEVVVSHNIVTARSMLYSIPFGLKILELVKDKATSEIVAKQIRGI